MQGFDLPLQLAFGAAGIRIQRMPACPTTWPDPLPPAWRLYPPDRTSVFHCGFRGILETRIPTPDDPQNECFYDHSGTLVTESHPYAGCRGTPNQYDQSDSPIRHALSDTGGIVHAGGPAFITSRVYDVTQAVSAAIQVVSAVAGGFINALGQAIVMGIMVGRATCDPTNWTYQGLPSRSIRHLNVMGLLLSSIAWNDQNVQTLLTNITRRLDSYPIQGLLSDLAADINTTMRARNASAPQVTAAQLGELSLLHLAEFLRTQGLITYNRPPEDIAREQLAAQPAQ